MMSAQISGGRPAVRARVHHRSISVDRSFFAKCADRGARARARTHSQRVFYFIKKAKLAASPLLSLVSVV
jgi:hypothetical protein